MWHVNETAAGSPGECQYHGQLQVPSRVTSTPALPQRQPPSLACWPMPRQTALSTLIVPVLLHSGAEFPARAMCR
jgi:hypothetical protein